MSVLATRAPPLSHESLLQPPKKVDKKAAPAKAGKEKAAKGGGKAKKKVGPRARVWCCRFAFVCGSARRLVPAGRVDSPSSGVVPLSLAMQKWSKGKVKEKVANAVFFDKALYEKCVNEVPKFKLITASIISERMRVNGSLARRAIKDLMAKGLIRVVWHPHPTRACTLMSIHAHVHTQYGVPSASLCCGIH